MAGSTAKTLTAIFKDEKEKTQFITEVTEVKGQRNLPGEEKKTFVEKFFKKIGRSETISTTTANINENTLLEELKDKKSEEISTSEKLKKDFQDLKISLRSTFSSVRKN